MIRFETASLTSAGGREDNEDSCEFVMRGECGCWVVADGLGGHSGGSVASGVTTEVILRSFDRDPEGLPAHIEAANRAILDRQKMFPQLSAMRTTVAALAASPECAVWLHVGDSRLYWFENGRIRARTKDHSVPQLLADAGEIREDQIRMHEDRNRLLRCLGQREPSGSVQDRLPRAPRAGDAFLLASDGFWHWVNEGEMEERLAQGQSAEDWLKRMEVLLCSRACGGFDNYSAIAVVVRES